MSVPFCFCLFAPANLGSCYAGLKRRGRETIAEIALHPESLVEAARHAIGLKLLELPQEIELSEVRGYAGRS
jgi:hypothetical protein